MNKRTWTVEEIDRMIQMGWEDRTPFEAISKQFNISHNEFIKFMREHMQPSSFKMWRKRTYARKTKHNAYRELEVTRFKSPMQKN